MNIDLKNDKGRGVTIYNKNDNDDKDKIKKNDLIYNNNTNNNDNNNDNINNIRLIDLINKEYEHDELYQCYKNWYISTDHLFYKIWERKESISLTPQHFKIADDIYRGKNVFVTGKAGTGKSYFLKLIIEILKEEYGGEKVRVCAPTATAAVNINAITFHSLFGLPWEMKKITSISKKLIDNGKADEICEIKYLIIDEISQLSPKLFEFAGSLVQLLLSEKTKHSKQILFNNMNKRSYGNIQLIVFGDFKQIGPVIKDDESKERYCKDTKTWKELNFHPTILKHIFRQKGDNEFISILNEISNGSVSLWARNLLKSRIVSQSVIDKMEIKPLPLVGRKKDANDLNNLHLKSLYGEEYKFSPFYNVYYKRVYKNNHFEIIEWGSDESYSVKWPAEDIIIDNLLLFKNNNPFEDVNLKIGAQVMLTANIDVENGFINGLLGKVIFFDLEGYPIVRFENDKTACIRYITRKKKLKTFKKKYHGFYLYVRYLPLILAAAISIHKCQGKTLSKIELSIDRRNIFTYHMAYCALSRATSLEGVYLRKFDHTAIKLDPDIKKYYEELEKKEKEYIQSLK